jgi:hypothetical protein
MSAAPSDLISGYLAGLCAGLRVPAAEAELILAEAEDHLRETAAAGREAGMTELEAQQSAIASFGPVRAVARAHRRRPLTAGAAAMAGWKLAGLLSATVGAGGIAGMAIFAYSLRSGPGGPGPLPTEAVVYAAMVAGGVVLLAARRLARGGTPGRDLLSPGVTAGCFLLASAALGIYGFLLRSAPPLPGPPQDLSCAYSCNWPGGPLPGPGPAVPVLVAYAAMGAGVLVLLAARWRARRGRRGRRPLSAGATTSCFLLAAAPLLALIVIRAQLVKGQAVPIAPMITASWLTPVSQGSVSAAPLVSGAVVAGCLAVALGFAVQAAVSRARRRRAQARLLSRVPGQADRGGESRAYA